MECVVSRDLAKHLAAVDREDAYEEWLDAAIRERLERLEGMGDDDLAAALDELIAGTPAYEALFDTNGNLLPGAARPLRTWVSNEITIERIRISLTRSTH
ncbi:hypothetical protein [Burkholderia multivorans]|uniref:hypothetical protein n=1 Tax=Burkholderia multivorans TaxID=87883 RepID=UPI000D009296|nr:hypothetical protein [Burkholderia multivorans]PRF55369.1 hypothetical protein C6Q11_05505 [Burkholderia multivorans]